MANNTPGSKPFELDTTWDELGWNDLGGGIMSSKFVLGDPGDPESPVVFNTFFPAGFRLEPHHHSCDYAEIILEGEQEVTGRMHYPGTVRVVHGGRGYGPLIAGPDGVHVIVMMRNQNFETHFGGSAKAVIAEQTAGQPA
jgi:hypothetical protein